MKAIITTICLLASLGISVFGVWPEFQDLQANMSKAEIKEIDLANRIGYNDIMKEMVNMLEGDYNRRVDTLTSSLPEDHYVPSLFATIKRIADQTDVTIANIGEFSVQEDQEDSNIKNIDIEITIEGTYQNFRSFIAQVENSSRIINLKSMNITRPPDNNSGESFKLVLETYSY